MVVFTVHLDQLRLEVAADFGEGFLENFNRLAVQHLLPVLGHEDQMDVHIKNTMSAGSNIVVFLHRPKYNIPHNDTLGI